MMDGGSMFGPVVEFVGMAKSTRDDHTDKHPVFALNESGQIGYLKRLDHLFQIHEFEDFSRENNPNNPNHFYWLINDEGPCRVCKATGFAWADSHNRRSKTKKCKHCSGGIYTPTDRPLDITIWMQEEYPQIPGSRRYPLEDVIDKINFPIRGPDRIKSKYFTNSLSYALGLVAVTDEIEEIRIFGTEAASDTEWAYQKPGIEFWGGYLGGMDKVVWTPESCRLFNQGLYGYEVGMYVSRQELERYERKYERDAEAGQQKVSKIIGKLQMLENLAKSTNSMQQKQNYQRQSIAIQQQLQQAQAEAQATHAIHTFAKFLVGRIDGRHPETAAPVTLREMEEGMTDEAKELVDK
jgi:hypothetical protein